MFTLKDNTQIEEEKEISVKEYSYAGDEMRTCGGEICEYDVIGNPTTYRGKKATWTNGRFLNSYNNVAFSYDGLGRRIKKGNISYTYDSQGRLLKQSNGLEFLYDHSGVFAVKNGETTYFYRKDAQSNITAIIDSEGSVVARYLYNAWGEVSVVDNTGKEITDKENIANLNPYRYRSYYYDTETGLFLVGSRYYDPETGRFISPDDISYLDPTTIGGLNLYSYCLNNPVMYRRIVMKDRNSLTYEDREFVTGFIRMKYPPIYKTDKTDRILFVELVEFDVCPYLLGQRQIDSEQYSYILDEYERYLSQTDISIFDEYAKEHFKIMVKLIDLFKKYYNM